LTNPEILTSNNRIKGDQDGDTVNDYTFDSSGNTTLDAGGQTYVYDAENKMISASDVSETLGEYFYDGDGRRVKKIVPSTGEVTVFVYDAASKLIGEYSTVVQTGSNAKTVYTTNDHLGSPRINTDATGQVISRHDYHPFGEEIATPQRTSGLGYTSDTIRKQFTGYERDIESELDYAQARYYNSAHGRFTSTDPVLMMPDRQIDPQQINLYAYCRNNPLSFIDPTGMILDPSTWGKDERKAYENYVAFLNKDAKKYASELATLDQLKKSDVNYVVKLDQSGTDYSNGKEGGVTTDGKDVFINIANQGNGAEKLSLNATFGHELEHARQFDSGEFGFVSDNNGKFVDKDGKFIGRTIGVDITDEIKAWAVTAKLATNKDMMVMGGSSDPAFQFRILDSFNKATTDADKGAVLGKIADSYGRSYARNKTATPSNNPTFGQPVGTLIRPSQNVRVNYQDSSGKSLGSGTFFGRTH